MSDITDAEEVKILLLDILNLFESLDEIKKNVENDIYTEELKQEDYLHELEIAKLNGIEIMKVAKELRSVRQDRRVYKNKLELLKTVKCFTDKFVTKGIIADARRTIENIDKLVENQATRSYIPRIIKDLKCAKHRKKEEEM